MIGRLSMRVKFLAAVSVMVVLLGASLIIALQTVIADDLSHELELRGVEIALATARECESEVLTESWAELQMILNEHSRHPDLRYLFVVGETGSVLADTFGGRVARQLLTANSVAYRDKFNIQHLQTDDEAVIDIAVPILDGKPGQLRIGISEAAISAELSSITWRTSYIVGGVLLLALIASTFLARALTRPLERLTSVAQSVGGGDFQRKVGLPAGNEFGQLGAAFDGMVEELHHRYQLQESLNGVLSVGLDDLSLEEMLNKALQIAFAPEVPFLEGGVAVFLTDHESRTLLLRAHQGLSPEVLKTCSTVPFGRCPCGIVAETALPFDSAMTVTDSKCCLHHKGPHGHYCVPMLHGKSVLGVLDFHLKTDTTLRSLDRDYLRAVGNVIASVIARREALHRQAETAKKLRQTLGGVIEVISIAGERRDPYSAGHQKRVSDLARTIATRLRLPADEVDGIRVAGVIHDIGKLCSCRIP